MTEQNTSEYSSPSQRTKKGSYYDLSVAARSTFKGNKSSSFEKQSVKLRLFKMNKMNLCFSSQE